MINSLKKEQGQHQAIVTKQAYRVIIGFREMHSWTQQVVLSRQDLD